ncbi:MAG: hypothetical protein PVJ60_03960 [Phycisphaerales bacterium]|jgi:hypothetical protein
MKTIALLLLLLIWPVSFLVAQDEPIKKVTDVWYDGETMCQERTWLKIDTTKWLFWDIKYEIKDTTDTVCYDMRRKYLYESTGDDGAVGYNPFVLMQNADTGLIMPGVIEPPAPDPTFVTKSLNPPDSIKQKWPANSVDTPTVKVCDTVILNVKKDFSGWPLHKRLDSLWVLFDNGWECSKIADTTAIWQDDNWYCKKCWYERW